MAKEKISKKELAEAPKAPLPPTSGNFVGDLAAFRKLGEQAGVEMHAGLNVLRLDPGQSAGPFTLREILKDQVLGKKIKNPTDVYVAVHEGVPFRMPAAASFVSKAQEAKLGIGDVFHVARDEDYKSKYGTPGKAYLVAVVSRAKK